ncbi:MAG: PAS domain S-box protein, partial [Leptospiraceae bacterium]|nr:PAS domain S-box protein [Leptospiraceae bacterium]
MISQDSENKDSPLMRLSSTVFWQADAVNFIFNFVSSNAVNLFGYTIQEWHQTGFWARHIHPEDREEAVNFCKQCISRKEDHEFEYRFLTKDKQVRYVRDIVNISFDKAGEMLLHGLMIDITDLRHAEEILHINTLALTTISQGVIVTDPEQKIISCNKSFSEITGYPESEIIGKNCRFLQGEETNQHTRKLIREAITEKKEFNGEILNYRKDGTPFWNELSISPVLDQKNRLTQFV